MSNMGTPIFSENAAVQYTKIANISITLPGLVDDMTGCYRRPRRTISHPTASCQFGLVISEKWCVRVGRGKKEGRHVSRFAKHSTLPNGGPW